MLPANGDEWINVEPNSKKTTTSFLDLPFDIRAVVYRHLLIASIDPPDPADSELIVRGSIKCEPRTFDGQYMLQPSHYPSCASINTAILQTCKQIHAEAWPLVYSENTFHRCCPFITSNLLYVAPNIQSLDLWLENAFELDDWLVFLSYMDDFTTLRFLSITFGEDNDDHYATRLGKSLRLARRTSQIKGLKRLTIEGFYGKHWPSFFRSHMDCEVVSYAGFRRLHPRYLSNLPFRSLSRLDFETLQAKRFWRYSEATRNLDPANDELLEEEAASRYWGDYGWTPDEWEEDVFSTDDDEDEDDMAQQEQHNDT